MIHEEFSEIEAYFQIIQKAILNNLVGNQTKANVFNI